MDWTTVEMASAIVCASLPTYGPIMSRASTIFPSLKSWYISLRSSIQRDRSNRMPYGSDRQKQGSAQTFDLQPMKFHAVEEDAATGRDSRDTSSNLNVV